MSSIFFSFMLFQILHQFSISTLLLHFLPSAMATIYADQHKFLKPFLLSNPHEVDDQDSDHFRMYSFKIRMCNRTRSHDWTDCPFAHPGEKARRRDLRRYHYSATVCADFRRGNCNRGDNCEFAHGVFEYWLHPDRYRTEVCKDGKNCNRKICFFAHIPKQLRNRVTNCYDYFKSWRGNCKFDREDRDMNELVSSMNSMMRLRDDGLNPCNDGDLELIISSSFGSVDIGVLACPDFTWIDDLLDE